MPPKKILLAEDHKLLREGLKSILASEKEFQIVGEARDGQEAIHLIRGGVRPDLVLLDLSMPRMDGFSVLRAVKSDCPGIRALVLTVHKSEQYVHEAFRAGADGYCLKDSSREELLMAMRSTLEGKMYISPGVAKSVMNGYLTGRKQIREKTSWESLTPREKEILKLIAESYQNKEIAQLLNISVKTVEKHRGNLIEKLNLHSSTALTVYAYEHGLINRSS